MLKLKVVSVYKVCETLCSRLRPDVRDRQTDVRRASSLNAPTLGAGA